MMSAPVASVGVSLLSSVSSTLPLTRAAASYLQPELEYRLRFIIQEARKLAEHSFRKYVTRQDIEDATLMISGRRIHKAVVTETKGMPADPTLTEATEIIAPSLQDLIRPQASKDSLLPSDLTDAQRQQRLVRNAIASAISSNEPLTLLQMLQQCVRNRDPRRAMALLHGLAKQSKLAVLALQATSKRHDAGTHVRSALDQLMAPVLALLQSEQDDCIRGSDPRAHIVICQILRFLVEEAEVPLARHVDDIMSLLLTSLVHRSDIDRAGSMPTRTLLSPLVVPETSLAAVRRAHLRNLYGSLHSPLSNKTPVASKSSSKSAASDYAEKLRAFHVECQLRVLAGRVLGSLLCQLGTMFANLPGQAAAVLLKILLSPVGDLTPQSEVAGIFTLPTYDGENFDSALPLPSASTYGALLGLAATGHKCIIATLMPVASRIQRVLDNCTSLPAGFQLVGGADVRHSPWLSLLQQTLSKVVGSATRMLAHRPTTHPQVYVQAGSSAPSLPGTIQVVLVRRSGASEAKIPDGDHEPPAAESTADEMPTKAPTRSSKRKNAVKAVSETAARAAGTKRGRPAADGESQDETPQAGSRTKRARNAVPSISEAQSSTLSFIDGVVLATSIQTTDGSVSLVIRAGASRSGAGPSAEQAQHFTAIDGGESAVFAFSAGILDNYLI